MIADNKIKLPLCGFVEIDGHVPALLRQVIKSVSLLRQQAYAAEQHKQYTAGLTLPAAQTRLRGWTVSLSML